MSAAASRRLVHVITDLDLGGAEQMLVRLAPFLARAGWEQEVVSLLDPAPLALPLRAHGIPTRVLGRRALVAAGSWWRALRRQRPAVLQGWMYHGNLAASLARSLGGGTAEVWNIRQSLPDLTTEKRSTARVIGAGARLSHRVNAIIFNSTPGMADHARVGYCMERAVLVPNGIDTAVFRPDPEARAALRAMTGWDPDCPVVGLVARYHPVKGHADFLQAARLVHAALPRVRFLLVGTGVTEANAALPRLCDALELRHVVRLHGPVASDAQVARLTAALDVACCASLSEAWPNVVAEALACGVPCVATRVGDVPEMTGAAGFLVPPGVPAALGDAIIRVLRMPPALRHEVGMAGRQRIVSLFSIEAAAARYDALYRRVLAGDRVGTE